MKGNLYTRMVCILAFLFFLTASAGALAQADKKDNNTGRELKQDVMGFIESLKNYSAEKQKEAAGKLKTELGQMDERLEKMERRFEEEKSEMSRELREKMESDMELLRRQRDELAELYEKFKSGSADAWGRIRQDLSKAFRDFSRSLEKTDQQMERKNI
ncbi:MAG: hypothetical protein K9J85_03455 [Desulfobacteraceae bacterium]|nr:hypothetical protein [Desulfobacteraceae bacterium]